MRKSRKNSVSTAVGRKIKAVRKYQSISGNQLAQLTGLTQQQISRYESGKTSMTIDTIVRIAQALDISVAVLLDDYLTPEYDDTNF